MKKKIAELKELLTKADALAAEIASDPSVAALPQPAVIRASLHNGALVHLEALAKLAPEPAAK